MATVYNLKNDRDLVLACQRREPAAFEELVKRNQRAVYTLLFQLGPEWQDTKDLSQEVFIRVWRTINNLRNPSSFRTWLIQLVMQLFYEEVKKRPAQAEDILSEEVPEITNEVDRLQDEEIPLNGNQAGENQDNPTQSKKPDPTQLVHQALIDLPEPLRTPLVLRELENMNYEEIAILTRTEVGTVKIRIAQARTRLRNALASYFEHYLETGVSA